MSYVLEREGIAAYPDDPLRVASPDDWTAEEERRYDRHWNEHYSTHKVRLLRETQAVLAGSQSLINIEGRIYDRAELFEVMTQDEELDYLAPLLLGNKELGRKVIEKFCDEWATHAANRDMQRWSP
ncbi:hypothetical protein D7I39_11105 [Allopusillimonas ginsengisoli]|nr:hypothetical protein D7I39_11105 [Allopusillimonas ginsengisoli]